MTKLLNILQMYHKSFEIELLQLQIGNSESQQILESLAGLVAFRLWSKHWQQTRVELAIRADNIGALVFIFTHEDFIRSEQHCCT